MNDIRLYRGERLDNGEIMIGWGCARFGMPAIMTETDLMAVVPETLAQETGLQDCHGVQAFHKDKVNYEDDNGNKQAGTIEWNETFTGYYARAINGDDEGNQDGQLWNGNFVIIK